jgi:hypothetical protein
VAIPIVDQNRVFSLEAERESPVAIYAHRPVSGKFSLKQVQLPASDIHRLWRLGSIQKRELPLQLDSMAWLNAALRPRQEELLDALVPEALDRPLIVYRNATLYNRE